jgi:hypothetical protein
MTPKEKAEELFDKFLRVEYPWPAKECTLIAVDEIIEDIKFFADAEIMQLRIIYWKKVKQEIEKL